MEVIRGKPVLEGAGVRLRRIFGYHEVPKLDPFLLLDHFGSEDPKDYMAGFPWHPHRGIETVTYMLAGEVEHGDSLGNSGVIGSGDVQWMTAGRGILHQEMPRPFNGSMRGFQLWVNLPGSHKMMEPRYRDIASGEIPGVAVGDAMVKVIKGTVDETHGPARDIVVDTEYLDIALPAGKSYKHKFQAGFNSFLYCYQGMGMVGGRSMAPGEALLLGDIPAAKVDAVSDLKFLLASGRPLGEPVAWRGPIVMNTRDELDLAFSQLRAGTFIQK